MEVRANIDLGLSLSLKCHQNHKEIPSSTSQSSSQLNLKRSSHLDYNQKSTFEKELHSSTDARTTRIKRTKTEPNLEEAAAANRGELVIVELDHIDELHKAAAASSPNSTVSSVSGKREISDEEDGVAGGGEGERKKLRLTKDQSAVLETAFKEHTTLNTKQKVALAKQLSLRPRQVEVWFQNRRARTKLKQTEVDCEYLKRYCEKLTEENRRLQKEVQELRALKLSPELYSHMNPPTTLTICCSCDQRMASSSASSPSSAVLLAKSRSGSFRQPLMPVKQQQQQGSTAVHNENLLTL